MHGPAAAQVRTQRKFNIKIMSFLKEDIQEFIIAFHIYLSRFKQIISMKTAILRDTHLISTSVPESQSS